MTTHIQSCSNAKCLRYKPILPLLHRKYREFIVIFLKVRLNTNLLFFFPFSGEWKDFVMKRFLKKLVESSFGEPGYDENQVSKSLVN